jgi:GNAT superfamily N-acetyltransferase
MTIGMRVRDMSTEVSESIVREIYHDILEPSFRPNELDTFETLLEGLRNDEVWGVCALEGATPVGCVLGYPYPQSQVLLIGYVTVKPGLRGGGIGSVLMDAAEQRWFGNTNFTLVVAEVEDPRRYPVTEGIDPKRRAQFYGRRGGMVVVGPYFQPRLEGAGKNRVRDLFLTVLDGAAIAASAVPAEQLTGFLLEYFRDSGEGSDFPRSDDDEGSRLIAWYRTRTTVPLHPIADYTKIEIPSLGL